MRTVIALAGLAGSGKGSLCKRAAERLGIPSYYIGQILLDECKRRGLAPTYENRMGLKAELPGLNKGDSLSLLRYACAEIDRLFPDGTMVILDSIRSTAELEYLKATENHVVLLAVVLDKDQRLSRLVSRDHTTVETVAQRDIFEIGGASSPASPFNLGELIARADYYIESPADDVSEAFVVHRLRYILAHATYSNHPTELHAN